MILRKPYALFIKSFKLLHLILAVAMTYLFYRTTLILNFFGEAIQQPGFNLSRTLNIALFDFYFYLIPIIVILITGLIMGVLIYKQKPFRFYILVLIIYAVILTFNGYLDGFLYEMEIRTMSAQNLSLMRDFVLIALMLQFGILVKYFITGIGFDIRQFDFGRDLEDMAIEEADREEFEVNVQIDFHALKRKFKNWWQEFKYLYQENKFLVTSGLTVVFLVLSLLAYTAFSSPAIEFREGDQIVTSNANIKIKESYITNRDYRGREMLADSFLLVIKAELASRYGQIQQLDRSQFRVTIGNYSFYHNHRFGDHLIDFGSIYFNQEFTGDAQEYIFAFEIPADFIERQMRFDYVDVHGDLIEGRGIHSVLLKPENIDDEIVHLITRTQERMYFNRPILHSYVELNSYELSEYFALNYRFCGRTNRCFTSTEYLRPGYSTNYDLALLRVDGDFVLGEQVEHLRFNLGDFLRHFAFLRYEIDGELKTRRFVGLVRPQRAPTNDYFLEVPKEALHADNLKIIVLIRDHFYEYRLQ